MDETYALILVARWLHILAATLSVGVPIYLWLVLMPALTHIDADSQAKLREASAKRWRILVYVCITIFLVTGLFNFLHVRRWHDFEKSMMIRYHILFTVKFILALMLFFLLSALAGRSKALEYFRKSAGTWMMVSALIGVAIVVISGIMRFMDKPAL
jgi:uncharacterized membrane protein